MRNALPLFTLLAASVAFAAEPDSRFEPFARLGGTEFRHPEYPTHFSFRPDGKHLASGGSDGSVRIWDVESGKLIETLKVKDGIVTALEYTPSGKWLFVHFGDGKLRVFGAETHKHMSKTDCPGLRQFTCTSDGELIAGVQGADVLALIDPNTGDDRLSLPHGSAVAVSRDGNAIALIDEQQQIQVLQIPSGKPLLKIERPKLETAQWDSVAISPDGKRFAVGTSSEGGKVRVYSMKSDKAECEFRARGSVKFAGNDMLLARKNNQLLGYDLKEQKIRFECGRDVSALAVTPDGKLAATDAGLGMGCERIRLWDLEKGKERAGKGLQNVIGVYRGKEDNEPIAFIATATSIARWPTFGEVEETPFDTGNTIALVFGAKRGIRATPNGLQAHHDNGLKDWKLPLENIAHLAGDRNGIRLAATTGPVEPALILLKSGQIDTRKLPLDSPNIALAVSPDGEFATGLGRDGGVKAWRWDADPKNPKPVWIAKLPKSPHGGLAYSPDGKRLAVASKMKLVIFEAETGKELQTFDRSHDDGPYVAVAWSPSGNLLAACSMGSLSITVWEPSSNAVVKRFIDKQTTPWQICFADENTLVTCGSDDGVAAWDLTGRRGQKKPTNEELKTAWKDLGGDIPEAWEAKWLLMETKESKAFLMNSIKNSLGDIDSIRKHLDDLKVSDFAKRKAASDAIEAFGPTAIPLVAEVLAKPPTLEVKEWADALHRKLTKERSERIANGDVDEAIRLPRVAPLLEKIGTEEAKKLLARIK